MSLVSMSETPKPYHHGSLTEELIATAITLIEENGVEELSLRAVARRIGVSPAAPFRHFSSKSALLAAVAEQAMARLRTNIELAFADAEGLSPMAVLEAFGLAYLRWASENPTHFQVISSRALVDFANVPGLTAGNAQIRSLMEKTITQAQDEGHIPRDINLGHLVLSLRAFAYGLARMRVDGHLPEWHPGESPDAATAAALRQYLGLLTRR
jgi:AcrR family transcriptional regulator